MERIVVIGGAGFGGSGLVKRLLKQGSDVKVIDAVAPLMADALASVLDHPNFQYRWQAAQDLRPGDFESYDRVVHLAAQADVPMGHASPRYTVMQNVDVTVHLLETVRQVRSVKQFLYAGSGNEWGRALYFPVDEEHPLTPHNPYAFSKAAAEMACWAWHRCYNVPVTIMSNGIVTGPGMRRNIFLFIWLRNIFLGRPLIIEGGDQTRDVTYVGDVLDAWELALRTPLEKTVGQKFQVSYGEEHSVLELAQMCMDVTGRMVPLEFRAYRPGEQGQREYFSTEKARSVLGYAPQVSPKEAIYRTAVWMRDTWFPAERLPVRDAMLAG